MKQKNISTMILVGITGNKNICWQAKLKEIEKYKISNAALFLENFTETQRKRIYKALLNSDIKKVPLVHIRNDMDKEELKFLVKNFGSKYFTIHEDSFDVLEKWRGYYKKLFLEMDTDNFISKRVKVEKIGGFCIDLSHFKVGKEKGSKEFDYIVQRRKKTNLFACNHLNGYSYEKNIDIHKIKDLKDFNYLKTLPRFLFGEVIALECENTISKQMRFKKHIAQMLKRNLNSNNI